MNPPFVLKNIIKSLFRFYFYFEKIEIDQSPNYSTYHQASKQNHVQSFQQQLRERQ